MRPLRPLLRLILSEINFVSSVRDKHPAKYPLLRKTQASTRSRLPIEQD